MESIPKNVFFQFSVIVIQIDFFLKKFFLIYQNKNQILRISYYGNNSEIIIDI